MVRLSIAVALSCALSAFALPQPNPLTADPNGDKNIGNGQGGQFITGACLSDADCQSGCCATLNGAGICSGPAVSFAQGKQGCGFGGSGSGSGSAPPASTSAAAAPPAATDQTAGNGKIDANAPGSQNVGTGSGQQFITGQCFTDADCASKCCAGKAGSSTGACSAIAVSTDSGKTGCGFVQN